MGTLRDLSLTQYILFRLSYGYKLMGIFCLHLSFSWFPPFPQKKEIKERFTIMVIHEGIKQLEKKSLSSLR